MFLTGSQLGMVFQKAKKQRFGIIASNVVFDTQIRAIVQGYDAVGSDGLMQMPGRLKGCNRPAVVGKENGRR